MRRLLVAASVVPSSSILVSLIKEELGSSETSVLTRATRRNIPEDTILQICKCYRFCAPKNYIVFPSASMSTTNWTTERSRLDSWQWWQQHQKQTNKQTPWPLVREPVSQSVSRRWWQILQFSIAPIPNPKRIHYLMDIGLYLAGVTRSECQSGHDFNSVQRLSMDLQVYAHSIIPLHLEVLN
jgi:hypothetical protein